MFFWSPFMINIEFCYY